eukprot:TRINITY_DN8687_c0_g1_i6.p1 TRINITY_DN8687_c0_g1~~TRINITY_DN8687_c0_g1_i6.p1  ORF type:complete len:991 (+),score=177.60 TRINITY_DN8687_c0_g1_i6:317-3289(+)
MFIDMTQRMPECPLHVVLGNHDMNLRHSRAISSLDGLQLTSHMENNKIFLHKEMEMSTVHGVPCLWMPYHHDQQVLVDNLKKLQEEKGDLGSVIGFGHLSVSGAKLNNSATVYTGLLGADHFAPFKRVFSGHFHQHQTIGAKKNVTYVGSPLQFNFGDVGEDRGIVIYNSQTDSVRHMTNPHGRLYVNIPFSKFEKTLQEPEEYKDKYVSLVFDTTPPSQVFHSMRDKLLEGGARSVRKTFETRISSKRKSAKIREEKKVNDISVVMADYLNYVHNKIRVTGSKKFPTFLELLENPKTYKEILEIGKSITNEVNKQQSDNSDIESVLSGPTFPAQLKSVSISNFLGVQGTIEIPFSDLQDGIWIIEGANGSGKSTLFEAIVWCHFGEFLRSGMLKKFAINDSASECSVTVEYESGFIIERSRRSGKTDEIKTYRRSEKNPEEIIFMEENEKGQLVDSQKRIESIIGIDFETFSKSVILGQNIVSNFMQGSSVQRRKILEEFIGLEKFDFYLDEAKARRCVLETEINSLVKQIDALEKTTESIKSALSQISLNVSEISSKLDEARAKYAHAEEIKNAQVQKLKDEKAELESQFSVVSKEISDLETMLESEPEIETTDDSSIRIQRIELRRIEEKLKKLQEKMTNSVSDNVKDLSVCPTCRQPLPQSGEEHVHEVNIEEVTFVAAVNIIEEARLPLSPLIHDDTKSISVLIERCHTLAQHYDDLAAILFSRRNAQEKLSSLKEVSGKSRLSIAHLENEILKSDNISANITKDITHEISMLEIDMKHLNSQKREHESSLKNITSNLKTLSESKDKYHKQFDQVKFWEIALERKSKTTIGFDSMRSFIFQEFITEMNIILQGYMESLCAGYNRELTATLNSDLDLGEIYGKRSGGERKRTDLALLFSLFEMIRLRSRYRPSYLMLDEVFDALDKDGHAAVQAVLIRLSQQVQKIFVITHNPGVTSGMSVAGHVKVDMRLENGRERGTEMSFSEV